MFFFKTFKTKQNMWHSLIHYKSIANVDKSLWYKSNKTLGHAFMGKQERKPSGWLTDLGSLNVTAHYNNHGLFLT